MLRPDKAGAGRFGLQEMPGQAARWLDFARLLALGAGFVAIVA